MVYQELFEARFHEMRHDYAQANEGRGYHKPSALRSLVRRLTTR